MALLALESNPVSLTRIRCMIHKKRLLDPSQTLTYYQKQTC